MTTLDLVLLCAGWWILGLGLGSAIVRRLDQKKTARRIQKLEVRLLEFWRQGKIRYHDLEPILLEQKHDP